MLIAITDVRTSVTSSISATAAAGTAKLLVGVASTLAVIETTLIGRCREMYVCWMVRCVPISGTTD